jgi:hypothetical protein
MKAFFVLSFVSSLLATSLALAQEQSICNDKILGTQFTLNVSSLTEQKTKNFEVYSCRKNTYWAYEVGTTANEMTSVSISAPDCELIGPEKCSEGCYWYPAHGMCMPNEEGKFNLSFHVKQFAVQNASSGPRGRNSFYAPNMFMLGYKQKLSDKNSFAVDFMGTTDKWAMSKRGYGLLLQAGEANSEGVPYIDAQHPHTSPFMGLTFSDIIQLGDTGQTLTFFFAPRGEATAGPASFMHRLSASVNPDAPISHHLQDVFHIASTVGGLKWAVKNTVIEASVFSGAEPIPSEVNLDTHKPDSYAFRVNQKLNKNFSVGASVARVTSEHRGQESGHEGEEAGHKEKELSLAAWLTTNHQIKGGFLNTSFIWGQISSQEHTLNSFLQEFVYQLGRNNFFGRVEILQRTSGQLNIVVTDGNTGAQWIKPISLGYERLTVKKNNFEMAVGGVAKKSYVATPLKTSYGGNPVSGSVYVRVSWGKNKSWE